MSQNINNICSRGSVVKNLPTMKETWIMWIPSLGQEEPLEEEMETHCSVIACEIPWTEEPGFATVHEGHKEPDTAEQLSTHMHISNDLL